MLLTGYVSFETICVGGLVMVEPVVPTGVGGVGVPAHSVEPDNDEQAPADVSACAIGTQN